MFTPNHPRSAINWSNPTGGQFVTSALNLLTWEFLSFRYSFRVIFSFYSRFSCVQRAPGFFLWHDPKVQYCHLSNDKCGCDDGEETVILGLGQKIKVTRILRLNACYSESWHPGISINQNRNNLKEGPKSRSTQFC